MREIKCKAFRKDSKEVGEVLSIDFENRRVKIEFYTKDNEFYIQNYELDDENIVIRWYTGLKDKNGTEIYEGDIVKFEDVGEEGYEYKEGFDFTNYASVEFDNGRWELNNFLDNNSGILETMNSCHEDFIAEFKSFEVIGNIYENLELLEGRE